ncbi:hypothetical protein Cni_G23478 [Canna indica]|uniref:Uncharacterized protein n=1 Tax=Canna indica TaxID=4628 RepID=A0AAQ3KT88_9LILI|nr:hypothetical protein Cni_G23478 [Canna indica]
MRDSFPIINDSLLGWKDVISTTPTQIYTRTSASDSTSSFFDYYDDESASLFKVNPVAELTSIKSRTMAWIRRRVLQHSNPILLKPGQYVQAQSTLSLCQLSYT